MVNKHRNGGLAHTSKWQGIPFSEWDLVGEDGAPMLSALFPPRQDHSGTILPHCNKGMTPQ